MTCQRLEVIGSHESLQRAWTELLKPVEHWPRDRNLEAELRSTAHVGRDDVVFRSPNGFEPASRVWIKGDDQGIALCSILPCPPVESISEQKYNSLVRRFFEEVIAPVCARTDTVASMSKAAEDLEDWMAPEPARCLRLFNEHSFRGESWTHSIVREAWTDFLISAHRTSARMLPWQLKEWLKKNGWSARKKAWALERFIHEYEFGRELLKAIDNYR